MRVRLQVAAADLRVGLSAYPRGQPVHVDLVIAEHRELEPVGTEHCSRASVTVYVTTAREYGTTHLGPRRARL